MAVTAKEVDDVFDCGIAAANEVVRITTDAGDVSKLGWREIDDVLTECLTAMGKDPDDYSIRSWGLEITHPEGEGTYYTEDDDRHIEGGDLDDWGGGTLACLEGKYLRCEKTYDRATQTWVAAPRPPGFYITNGESERQTFEEHFEECYLKSDRERLDYWQWLGPRDDDLVTQDFVTFKQYREYFAFEKFHTTFTLNLSERRICPNCGSPDTRVDRWVPTVHGNYPWFCENCAHEWSAPQAKSQTREDDPEAFYDDHKDAYWRIFYKHQNREGYYGNVWYAPRTGYRRDEWQLLMPPKNLAWQMADEWRKEFRARYGARRALAKDIRDLRPEKVGFRPEPGDLVSDNLEVGLPFGVLVYFVHRFERQDNEGWSSETVGPGPNALLLTQREVEDGTAWSRLLTFIAGETVRQRRPVQLWSQPWGFLSPWASWNLVPTFVGAPLALRAPGPRYGGTATTPTARGHSEHGVLRVGGPPPAWIKKGGLSGLTLAPKRRRRARRRR